MNQTLIDFYKLKFIDFLIDSPPPTSFAFQSLNLCVEYDNLILHVGDQKGGTHVGRILLFLHSQSFHYSSRWDSNHLIVYLKTPADSGPLTHLRLERFAQILLMISKL